MDANLIGVLVCPICKSILRYKKDTQELICVVDKLAYPIKDGIPVLLEKAARPIEEK